MFVRVSRKDQGLHFTVVDIQQNGKDQEPELILDMGIVQHGEMDGIQSWCVIAESLIASNLSEDEKCFLARDLASWLPPLSLEELQKTRDEDIRQLAEFSTDVPSKQPVIPAVVSEKDPLTIIAAWLASE